MRLAKKYIRRSLVIVGLMTLVASFYYYGWGPCGKTLVRKAAKQYSRVLSDWQTAVDDVPQIRRQNMDSHIAQMQVLRSTMDTIETPECMRVWRDQLLEQMDQRLDDLVGFSSGGNGISIDTQRVKSMRVRLTSFMNCAPKCSAKVVSGDPDSLNRIVHLKTRGGGGR